MTSLCWCHLVTFSRRFEPCLTVLKSLRDQISFWWIRRPKIFFASVLIVWFRQLILLLAPLRQRLRPQLVQLLLQSPLPPRQQHPLFSQTRLPLLYQQPGRNMPVCSAINRQQETRAVDLTMEEGRREPIVWICRTTEDRRGQEPLFALRPLLQANCQPQLRDWPWH